MMRQLARFAFALVLLVLASGCGVISPEPDAATNAVDRARLARLVADPWLRPSESSVGGQPSTQGKLSGMVERGIAYRVEDVPEGADVRARAMGEVNAAMAAGWTLVTVECDPKDYPQRSSGDQIDSSEQSPATTVPEQQRSGQNEKPEFDLCSVYFVKSMDDFDHEQLAVVCFSRYELSLGALCSINRHVQETDPPGKKILVYGTVPHHADRAWPRFSSVPLERTCLSDPFVEMGRGERVMFPVQISPWFESSGRMHIPVEGPLAYHRPAPAPPPELTAEDIEAMRGKVCPLPAG